MSAGHGGVHTDHGNDTHDSDLTTESVQTIHAWRHAARKGDGPDRANR